MTAPSSQTDATPRQRNQRGEGGRLRNEIIQAAMRILDRAPATELSLRMVAREAGVAPPSIYPHFEDARAMIAEIVRHCWCQVGDAMSAAADTSEGDAFATLRARVGAYVRYAMDRPSRYQLLFALQPLETEILRDLPGLVQPAYRNILDSIEALRREGRAMPARTTIDATLLVLSLAHGRVALAHTAPYREGNSTESVEAGVLDMLESIFQR
jgi:AcrR family transcriptional regulator